MKVEASALIVQLDDGKCYQVALGKEEMYAVLHVAISLIDGLKIIEKPIETIELLKLNKSNPK